MGDFFFGGLSDFNLPVLALWLNWEKSKREYIQKNQSYE